MAKIDLDTLGIEELASLRDRITEMLAEKVAIRHAELAAEMERLSLQYGKPARKSQGKSEVKSEAKSKRSEARAGDAEEPVAIEVDGTAGGEPVANVA